MNVLNITKSLNKYCINILNRIILLNKPHTQKKYNVLYVKTIQNTYDCEKCTVHFDHQYQLSLLKIELAHFGIDFDSTRSPDMIILFCLESNINFIDVGKFIKQFSRDKKTIHVVLIINKKTDFRDIVSSIGMANNAVDCFVDHNDKKYEGVYLISFAIVQH